MAFRHMWDAQGKIIDMNHTDADADADDENEVREGFIGIVMYEKPNFQGMKGSVSKTATQQVITHGDLKVWKLVNGVQSYELAPKTRAIFVSKNDLGFFDNNKMFKIHSFSSSQKSSFT